MKNSSLKKKRVVGMILAFLMVFNLVVFTGQVGAFADVTDQSTSGGTDQSNSGGSASDDTSGSTQNNSSGTAQSTSVESTSNGSVTVDFLTNFTELTSVSEISGKTEIAMIPKKYDNSEVIIGLPDGSALVRPIALASDSEKLGKISVFENLVSSSSGASSTDLTNAAGKYCIDPNNKGKVFVVQPSKAGKYFDHCPYGSITYKDNAWYYNCCRSGVTNAGPFYIYSYETKPIEIPLDDIVIKAKNTFTPSLEHRKIDESDFEATITVENKEINKVIEMSTITLDPTDNSVNPLKGDCTVTAVFGLGENVAKKEIVAAVQLTSSDIRAKLNTSKYSGTSSKTFTTDDVMVEYRVDDQWHETDEFELLDATVNPLNGDTTISISLAGVNKVVEAAKPISGNVSANGTTDIKELVQSVQTIQAKPNSVIANNSITAVKAAIDIMKSEKLNQYVTEAIDLGDANVIVKDDGTAAKLQAKVNTMDASVIANALTPEEIVKVLSGEKVDLRLEVVVDETSNAKETTGGQLIEKNLEANQNAYYFTADLFKIFNDNEDDKSSITEFADAISFTIDIPEELRSEGRAFTLIASHENADGTFETFELVDTDDDDTTFTASTTKLCTMALVYADEAVAETPIVEDPVIEPAYNYDVSPETADLRNILWAFIITVSAGAVLVVTFRKEFQ